MAPSKDLSSLSDTDRGLIDNIDKNYRLIESIMGEEPLIWFEFGVLPPLEEPFLSQEWNIVNQKRQAVFGSQASKIHSDGRK